VIEKAKTNKSTKIKTGTVAPLFTVPVLERKNAKALPAPPETFMLRLPVPCYVQTNHCY